MKNRIVVYVCLVLAVFQSCSAQKTDTADIWSKEKASTWYDKQGWLSGANFIPSNAINQLEMWQADTFDPVTIDRELGWAAAIGMNTMRVFLHHALWETDKEGFKKRINQYLDISHKHKISTMFVFFDDCWNPDFKVGKQPSPKPGVHNSGWLRDPGDLYYKGDTTAVLPKLEEYVKDILSTFKSDERILMWDLYNEPGGSGPYRYNEKSLFLLQKIFSWARSVNPSQPVTAGIWDLKLQALNNFQLENSDIVTYHTYEPLNEHKKLIDSLKQYGRPLICTEYMARTQKSTFQDIMPMLKQENVGAINWGLVSGKTNTIFAWDTPLPHLAEPTLWFHDIFRKDGTAYQESELQVIRSLTGAVDTQK